MTHVSGFSEQQMSLAGLHSAGKLSLSKLETGDGSPRAGTNNAFFASPRARIASDKSFDFKRPALTFGGSPADPRFDPALKKLKIESGLAALTDAPWHATTPDKEKDCLALRIQKLENKSKMCLLICTGDFMDFVREDWGGVVDAGRTRSWWS